MRVEAVEHERVRSLREVFESLSDRRRRKGVRFSVASVLSLCVVALMSGCENPAQIEHFGRQHEELLEELGFRAAKRPRRGERRGRIFVPSNDTISRVLSLVDQREFNRCMAAWLCQAVTTGGLSASIDGKSLRGSEKYVLSVFVNRLCQVIWQEDVGSAENELSSLERSLPSMLECLAPIGLFTADAGLGHKSIARLLVKGKRDYLLQLKHPHRTDVGIAGDRMKQLVGRVEPVARTVEKKGVPKARRS